MRENVCIRNIPDHDGYLLVVTHSWETLWYVGSKVENGVEKLDKVEDRMSAVVWNFTKVY